MRKVRTIRRSTEVANLVALCAFEVLGLFVLAVGVSRPSAILIVLGVLYAGGMSWYLVHLVSRVASELGYDEATDELTWSAIVGHGHVPLGKIRSVRRTSQPDVYAFELNDDSLVRFWHRNRLDDAQAFFGELRARRQDASFEALYLSSRASWRRGLPPAAEGNAPVKTRQ
jgi:hypothetical protein